MSTATTDRIEATNTLLDGLPTDRTGRKLPPATVNDAWPARHSQGEGWGWTHYFLLPCGDVVGHKLPGHPMFIARWVSERYGVDVMHLGRATPDPLTGVFYFEEWAWPLAPLVQDGAAS